MEVLQYLQNTLDGDKQSFNNVIDIYERKLYIIARTRLNNDWDIKDVIQDTFSYAFFNLDELRDLEKFNAWITKILINKCNKVHLRNKKIISYEELEGDNSIINNTNDFENLESSIDFFETIKFLNNEEKTIITMYFLKEYTTREMSEILKINESTLRSKIRKIKLKIKQDIERREK